MFEMNGNSAELASNLTWLQRNNWIDRQTRAVFVEFTLFNPNLNSFVYCYLMFELLPLGSIIVSYRFAPITLYDGRVSLRSFETVCAAIYLFMVFLLTLKQIYRVKVAKWRYLKQLGTLIDLSLIAFSYGSLSVWLSRFEEAQRMIQTMSMRNRRFINQQMLAYWDDYLACVLAFCVFLASLKIFKLMAYNRTIHIFNRTFRVCLVKLVSFGFFFGLMAFVWLQFGFLVFNDSVEGFSSVVKVIETGLSITMRKVQVAQMSQVNAFFGAVFHFTFSFLLILAMFYIFLCVIMEAFAKARRDEDVSASQLHLEAFLYEQIAEAYEYFVQSFSTETRIERKKVKIYERQMKHSLVNKDLYQDGFTSLDIKVGRVVSILKEFIQVDPIEKSILE